MSKTISQGRLIAIVEPMVQTNGTIVLASREGEQASIFFELVDNESIEREFLWTDEGVRAGSRVDSENALQSQSASGGGKKCRRPGWKMRNAGTRGFPGSFARASMIGNWAAVGEKILLFVSRGTESSASDRRPS